MPQSPRSPRQVKEKKARSYRLSDLIDDLETGDFSVYKPQWLLRPFGWNGATVIIRLGENHKASAYLVREALLRESYQAFRLLIEECQVDKQETSQALLLLCQNPQDKTILARLLLDHGASAECRDNQGRTSLHVAYESNQAAPEFLSELALHMNVNLTNNKGDAVLHQALMQADATTVRLLLKHGANPNQWNGQGQLPLVLAAHLPQSDLCLQLLLRYGADVHAVDATGRTALALMENPAASMVLLQRGARSDTADDQGVTPLHTALGLWCRWRRGENLSLLLFHEKTLANLLWQQAQQKVNLTDQAGRTPLHYACQVAYAPAPDYVQALVRQGAVLDTADINGWTPLHVAIAFGNYATAVRLMELGANVRATDSQGRTPLHLLGLDALAAAQYPQEDLGHSVRLVAFGAQQAPPAPFVAPLSPASQVSVDQEQANNKGVVQEKNDQDAKELVHAYLYQGFDFLTPDTGGNLPFFHAANDTARYLTVHAAACQGLLR